MWEIKNTVAVVIFILLRHNSLCERLTDSNHSYTEEPVLCTNFHVCVTLFVRDIDAYSATLTGAPLGQEGRPLLHYLKTKKCPDFGKKGPDSINHWVKFSIQNVVLRVSRRKNSKMFLCGNCFSCVFDKMFTTPPAMKNFWLRICSQTSFF